MMWRGTVFSTLLHGGVVVAIAAGIPVLPSIFDREPEIETGSGEQSISIEIVSADSVSLQQNVLALDKTEPSAVNPPTIAGALPPVQLAPSENAAVENRPDTSKPPSEPRVAKQRIPEGALDRPQSGQTSRKRPSPVRQRQVSPARKNEPGRQPEPSAPSTDTTKGPAQPSNPTPTPRAETQDAKKQEVRGAQPPSTSSPVSTAALPAEKAGSEETAPEIRQNITAELARNEFMQAVRGDKRDLVRQVLETDTRTRQAGLPRPTRTKITEQARTRTLRRFQQAAAKGHPHAQYNLAGKYLRGEDLGKDTTQALNLLTSAAQKGYVPAQSLLALLRYTGFGVPQDQAEAAFWWSLAADGGDNGAKIAVELIQKQLKPRELVKSKRLRARWGSLIADLAELTAGNTNRRDLDDELREASEKGDLDAVLSLLASGADADEAGDEGRNAVINAAWRGRERIIDLLLERGVATELPDDSGRTPLLWAAINGHIDIVRRLVESGANPNQTDRDGGTALIRASWNGHTDAVRSLIAAGADVNLRDGNGLSALDHASREGNAAIVKVLRAAGAR